MGVKSRETGFELGLRGLVDLQCTRTTVFISSQGSYIVQLLLTQSD